MGRPREHDETTRAALLGAAEKLLARGGPEALSIRHLAGAVGTSTRAVYSLFGSKPNLIAALYRSAFEALQANLNRLPETSDPVGDLVRSGAEGFRGHALAHPHLFRLIFEWEGRRRQVGDEDRAVGRAAFGMLVRRVQRCIDAGAIAGDAETIALGFHALCQGLASGGMFGMAVKPRDMPRAWREVLAAYVRGFRPPAKKPMPGSQASKKVSTASGRRH